MLEKKQLRFYTNEKVGFSVLKIFILFFQRLFNSYLELKIDSKFDSNLDFNTDAGKIV